MKKFDIVVVEFPFSDLSQTKKRPALVLASIPGSNSVLCQITTTRRSISTYEVPLQQHSCSGNIRFDSYIYVDMIFTLHHDLIENTVGAVVSKSVKQHVTEKIKALFDDE